MTLKNGYMTHLLTNRVSHQLASFGLAWIIGIAFVAMLVAPSNIQAQAPLLVEAEYFWDTDPGFGSATAYPAFTADSVVDLNLNIPLTGLSNGMHYLYVRVKDDQGIWTHAYHAPLYVQGAAATNIPVLEEVEYFFDTDPGFGNATSAGAISAGTVINENFNVPLTGLAPGLHQLYIRTKNALGEWSHSYHAPVWVDTLTTATTPNIVAAEYFWDINTLPGAGTPIPSFSPSQVIDQSFNIPLTGISPGLHQLYIRTLNDNGIWSHCYHSPVWVDTATSTTGPDIIAAEYFFDTDPGFGSGTAFTAVSPDAVVTYAQNVPLTGLSAGLHTFYARTMNANGVWSHTFHSPVYVTDQALNPDLIGAEYFWNTEPGFGNGTFVTFQNPGPVVDETLPISLCGLADGTHKLYLRTLDANGKWSHVYYSDVTVTNTGNPAAVSIGVSNNGPTCAGGSVQLTVTGAQGSSIQWTGPNGFTSVLANPTISNITIAGAGYYTATVTDGTCSQDVDSTLVTVAPAPVAAISGVTSLCSGNGTTLTASGGTVYAWSSGQSTAAITVTTAGTYTVTVSDGSSCSDTASVTVVVNPAPVAAITGTDTICTGSSSIFTATGGGTYQWSTGASTASITVNTAGVYTVTVTAANGCTDVASRTLVISASAGPAVVITGNDTICPSATTSLTASGGVSYVWSTGSTNATISGLSAGTYAVTASNAAGCTASATKNVVTDNSLAPTITGTDTICPGGSSTFTANGGASYVWSTGSTSASIAVSVAGTYTVTATNARGCTATATRTLVEATPPTASISGATVVCDGNSTILTASGGDSYSWSTGAATASVSVSAAGSYTVTVSDALGCTATTSATLTVNPLPTVTITGIDTIAQGGSSTFTANGGVSYVWSTTETTQSISVSNAAVYTVTATDANGCSATASRTLNIAGSVGVYAGEYFWDTDPGFGNATPYTGIVRDSLIDVSLNIPVTGLTPGMHQFYVRVIGDVGGWSHTYHAPVWVDTVSQTATTDIVAAEYFFNTDPGFDNATPFNPFTNASIVDVAQSVPLTGLNVGLNQFYVRVKNSAGVWSHTYHAPVWVDTTATSILPEIVSAEYFWDTDPGFGNATTFNAFAFANVVDVAQAAPLTGLSNGLHRFYVRVLNDQGTWSHTYHAPVWVSEDTATVMPDVVQSEYFFDTDPGFGNATLINHADAPTVSVSQLVSLAALTPGMHQFYIRSMDQNGLWTHTYHAPVWVVEDFTQPNLLGVEYFWDTEPGMGNGTFKAFTAQTPIVDEDVLIDLCGITTGTHKLYIRVIDDRGIFSHTYYADVNVTNNGGSGGALTISVSNSGPVCEGTDVQLDVTGASGATITWSGPNSFTSSISNPMLSNAQVTDAGYYVVTADNGCATATDSTLVAVDPAVDIVTVPTDSNVCVGDTILIDAGTFTASVTYDWSTGSSVQTLPISAPGTYSVTVTGASGACADTASIIVTQNATFPRVWTGNMSNDWFTHKNWTCGGVPNNTIDVIIPDVTNTSGNHPIILLNETGSVNSIYFEPSSRILLQGTLRVNDP